MKFKTTKKEVLNNYNDVIAVGYCGLQYLLKYIDPIAYTSGANGWNADIYKIDYNYKTIIITTGYRPFGKPVSYELVKKYDELAEKILNNTPCLKSKLDDLVVEFISESLKG